MDDFESLMATIGEKPVNDSALSRSSEEKSHRPLASPALLAKKGMTRPLAKMMPRVQCSRCEFMGKQGKEMRDHKEKNTRLILRAKSAMFFASLLSLPQSVTNAAVCSGENFLFSCRAFDLRLTSSANSKPFLSIIFEIRLAWTFSSSPETWFKMLLLFLACRLSASSTFLFTSVASLFASYSLFLVVMFAICPVMTVFFCGPVFVHFDSCC